MISPELKGIEVQVLVSGQPAIEYHVEAADMESTKEELDPLGDKLHIVRYIEAKSGEPFAVRVVRTPDFVRKSHHIACDIHTTKDNYAVISETSRGGPLENTWDQVTSCHAVINSDGQLVTQDWHFATLEVDTDDQDLSAKEMEKHLEQVKSLASITVKLYHMKKSRRRIPWEHSRVREEYNKIPEKALKGKALGLTASYKNTIEENFGSLTREVRQYNDCRKRPFAVFEFRYRTRENLYQEGVLERPVESGDKKAIVRGIKRETDNGDDLKERPERAYKERRLRGGRFEVDLTLSDSD
ncbi:hypothetical protein MCOR07_001948 [Pyricularia oryzae]|nr:hypothetical protein MCOR26_008747 [Pyricularia oryzae]KAI6322144.1 hypothetical protein MCOR34_002290 [Pyricularia oryzae]KAI6336929.1 hypothetical protein MCOR28_008903 [Pyricularia oryzae]KAI6383015.1 hypothetical protein MCOR32_002901 [Pyricularia oryzae]KAI6469306.1 hypothetical protein MCOR17_003864 [Pyricularia oryzae]